MTVERPTTDASRFSRRAKIIIGLAAVVVVVMIAILIAASLSATESPDPSPSGSVTTEPSPSESPSQSASPSSSPETSPTPTTIPIDAPGDISAGLQARISDLEAVEGTAQSPGQIAGPALRFRVIIDNTTSTSTSLGDAVVTVDYGSDRIPASELSEPGGSPLTGQVAAGASAEGTYIFTVPLDQRSLVRITVDYSIDNAPLVFEGIAP